ncbi:MAG: hypothetical protein P4M13_08640 [Alphaproteobacteria bacterium]|nr:hypothetical protein [Alphaproteobacteria bacterium]
MRRIPIAVFGFFVAVLLAPQSLHATGNVLLPSDLSSSENSASLPNLGLSASDNTQNSPAVSSLPVPKPAPSDAAPALPPQSAPDAAKAPQTGTLEQTPPPPAPDATQEPVSPADLRKAQDLPKGVMPTIVMHVNDTSDTNAQIFNALPHKLTVSFGPSSYLGARDMQVIGDKLGLDPSGVSSACSLSLFGLLQTNKGSYILDAGLGAQAIVHYDGIIKNNMITARAMCALNHAPPQGKGILTEMKDRYIVNLQQIQCASPLRQTSTLTVTYDGSGRSLCVYQ